MPGMPGWPQLLEPGCMRDFPRMVTEAGRMWRFCLAGLATRVLGHLRRRRLVIPWLARLCANTTSALPCRYRRRYGTFRRYLRPDTLRCARPEPATARVPSPAVRAISVGHLTIIFDKTLIRPGSINWGQPVISSAAAGRCCSLRQ